MEYRNLGRCGIKVSRLCFGSLTISPAQADLSPKAGGELIAYAAARGVNFIDTAELYENYAHLKWALHLCPDNMVIATKTYAYSKEQAEASFNRARRELDVDKIDIFLLHEQESVLTMDGHREAFAYLVEQKEKGLIGAVGLSTHAVEPVLALAQATGQKKESSVWQDIDPGVYRHADVIHPLLNMRGIGLLDGTAADMVSACRKAAAAGLGIYGMKILGGGHLLKNYSQALDFALSQDYLSSLAVGMQKEDEIDLNIASVEKRQLDSELLNIALHRTRKLLISDWCTGCGKCVQRCKEGALSLQNGQACVDADKCIFCGYCATVCRDFAIKVV